MRNSCEEGLKHERGTTTSEETMDCLKDDMDGKNVTCEMMSDR